MTIICLGRRLPAASCSLPGTQTRRAASRPPRRARSCLALLPVGVAWPPVSPRAPVVSYTTFSPSPRRPELHAALALTAVYFSVALFRQVTLPGRYPAPRPLEPGLSSPRLRGATVWPAQVHHHVSTPSAQVKLSSYPRIMNSTRACSLPAMVVTISYTPGANTVPPVTWKTARASPWGWPCHT